MGESCETAGDRLRFDEMSLQELRRRLAEHGLGMTNDGRPKLGPDDATLACVMIVLTVFFQLIDPCPFLVIICIAFGVVFGFLLSGSIDGRAV